MLHAMSVSFHRTSIHAIGEFGGKQANKCENVVPHQRLQVWVLPQGGWHAKIPTLLIYIQISKELKIF